MIKYTLSKNDEVLKDGHTMFPFDIVSELNRKAFLEAERKNNKKLQTDLKRCDHCVSYKEMYLSIKVCPVCNRALNR